MAVFDLLELPLPRVEPEFGFANFSWVQSQAARPWTFRFLDPELPRQAAMEFRGDEFYGQYTLGQTFDMNVSSGGDTFEICGSMAYKDSDWVIHRVGGLGSFVLRESRSYEREMVPAENPLDPDEFTGRMEIVETVREDVDTRTGVAAFQQRVVGKDRQITWQYVGGESPGMAPNFAMIGGHTFTGEVGLPDLDTYASDWEAGMNTLDDSRLDDLFGAPAYVRTQTLKGQYSMLGVGIAVVLASDVEPGYPEEYSTAGLRAVFETETRGNMPVVYDDDHGTPVTGNRIYGNGFARLKLEKLITEKIWKDSYGIYDQVSSALDVVPWVALPFGAGYEQAGEGGLSRGRFLSVDGGTYRVSLLDPEENVVLQVEVSPGLPGDYEFPLVATAAEAFDVEFGAVEVSTGPGLWAEIETFVGSAPGPGVRLVHLKKFRIGERWGHPEFHPQDPAPETRSGERRYALKTLRKIASP